LYEKPKVMVNMYTVCQRRLHQNGILRIMYVNDVYISDLFHVLMSTTFTSRVNDVYINRGNFTY